MPQNCRLTNLFLATAALVLVGGATTFAQNSSALISEALDKPVELDVDAPLPVALKKIEELTGVPIRAGKDVYDALPWGEQTKLTAKISNQRLRASLAAITQKLALRFVIDDEAVRIEPMPALSRVGRRSTVEELTAIDLLATVPVTVQNPTLSLTDLLSSVDGQLQAGKSGYLIDNRAGDTLGTASVRLPRDATLLDALEEIPRQSRATWYPWGKSIVIVPKDDHVRMLLNRPITVRYGGVDVAQVLTELSRRSGVDFTIEPGAVARIPTESRTVRLILENVSTRQALESVSGFTGLGYVINENGVYIWNTASSPVARRERVVGAVPLGSGVQLFLTDTDLPADVRAFLDHKRREAVDKLKEQMKAENYQPTTRPAG